LITEPALLQAAISTLTEGDGCRAARLQIDIEHVVPIALAHFKQLHPRIDARVVDQDSLLAQLHHAEIERRDKCGIGASDFGKAGSPAPIPCVLQRNHLAGRLTSQRREQHTRYMPA